MEIDSGLFHAYLECPTKCWLRATHEPVSANAYAEWVKTQNERYRVVETERMLAAESSAEIRSRIERARAIQQERFRRNRISCNARMNARMIRAHCALSQECQEVLRMAMEALNLSARAYDCPFV